MLRANRCGSGPVHSCGFQDELGLLPAGTLNPRRGCPAWFDRRMDRRVQRCWLRWGSAHDVDHGVVTEAPCEVGGSHLGALGAGHRIQKRLHIAEVTS